VRKTSIIYGEKKGERRRKLAYAVSLFLVFAVILSAYSLTRPGPEEVVSRHTGEILGMLEVLGIEYGEAVEAGTVERESEYEASKRIIDRVHDRYAKMRPFAREMNPGLAEEIETKLERLRAGIYGTSPPEEVLSLIEEISQDLRELAAA
jgi:hypothetical protein